MLLQGARRRRGGRNVKSGPSLERRRGQSSASTHLLLRCSVGYIYVYGDRGVARCPSIKPRAERRWLGFGRPLRSLWASEGGVPLWRPSAIHVECLLARVSFNVVAGMACAVPTVIVLCQVGCVYVVSHMPAGVKCVCMPVFFAVRGLALGLGVVVCSWQMERELGAWRQERCHVCHPSFVSI